MAIDKKSTIKVQGTAITILVLDIWLKNSAGTILFIIGCATETPWNL